MSSSAGHRATCTSTDSLCCTLETKITLQVTYTLLKNVFLSDKGYSHLFFIFSTVVLKTQIISVVTRFTLLLLG